MQTSFTLAQLADPNIAEADRILRSCVHCGFCTATCPTYVLLGDELDSPRGRIYLIKDMLENDRPATAGVVKHIFDQVNAPARRVEFVAVEHIGRTGRRAKAAMHASAQDLLRLRDIGIGKLREGEISLHREY